jgi:hypothetical protein
MGKRANLVKNLDAWFSRYIRLTYSKAGYGRCFTCGTRKHWKQLQAGHFQSRAKYSVRWSEDNVRPQCAKCNIQNGGQQYVFGQNLNKERKGLADEMVQKGHILCKYSDNELQEKIDYYREQVKLLLGD